MNHEAIQLYIYYCLSPLDITVELFPRDDTFIKDITHLTLELRLDGTNSGKVNLLSREATPGVWDADDSLFM
jgi:hypothetical protein